MAVANDLSFNESLNSIITDAFINIGVAADQQIISAADYNFALRTLNRMVSQWQAYDLHLWLKSEAILFLQKGQNVYDLTSPTSGDNATAAYSYFETTTTATSVGGSTLLVSSTSSSIGSQITQMSIGDNLGLILDSGLTYWTTISNISGLTITLSGTIPSQATSGAFVHTYTNKITRPLRIHQGRRYQYESSNEILFGDKNGYSEARETYFALPNKGNLGTPVIWYYDPQESTGIIYVWPTPSDSSYAMKFTYSRQIADFVNSSDTPDFPQEWLMPLVLNLSVYLCPSRGKLSSAAFDKLKITAKESLDLLLKYDTEKTSLKLMPDRRY